MANWQKDLGAAETGAGIGASVGSIIPGLGTAVGGLIGGGIGLISGLFSGDDEKPQLPADQNRGREDALVNELSSDKQSDATTNAQSRARRSFLDTMETYKNSGVGGNAAVLSKLGVKANDQLGENLVNINTADASERRQNKVQAERIMESQRNYDMQRDSANIDLAQKPSFLETLGQLGSSRMAGSLIGAIGQHEGRDLAGSEHDGGNSINPKSLDFGQGREDSYDPLNLMAPGAEYNPNPNNLPWKQYHPSGSAYAQ